MFVGANNLQKRDKPSALAEKRKLHHKSGSTETGNDAHAVTHEEAKDFSFKTQRGLTEARVIIDVSDFDLTTDEHTDLEDPGRIPGPTAFARPLFDDVKGTVVLTGEYPGSFVSAIEEFFEDAGFELLQIRDSCGTITLISRRREILPPGPRRSGEG